MNSLQAPQIDAIILKGGLDQITPSLSLASGVARQSTNFECSVTGGYTRIVGYERFDGYVSPTSYSETGPYRYMTIDTGLTGVTVGSVITGGTDGQTGTVVYIDGTLLVAIPNVMSPPADWNVGEMVKVGATNIGLITTLDTYNYTPLVDALVKNSAADMVRASISAPPGSGAVLSVFEYGGIVYAFRANAGGTAVAIWASSAAGWVAVPLLRRISFTGGSVKPSEGDTLEKGTASAVISRVVTTSGDWQGGYANGYYIVSSVVDSFTAGVPDLASMGTLTGPAVAITILPGGKYQTIETNFAGQSSTNRVYGCDGVNAGFEFDGSVYAPIILPDNIIPTHLITHKNYLIFSSGSSMFHSSPGLPYDFTPLNGAAEIAVGGTITDMITMPGGTSSATLGLFSRDNTYILYGSSPADWNMVSYNSGTGAVPFSAQNMAQTFVFDDRGVNTVQSSLQYGNFTQDTITASILPFITDKAGMVTGSTLCRRKSQYRLFFSDGSGLYITVVNGKLLGSMPVYLDVVVNCIFEGKNSTGSDVIYFGATNGMVYQMERGPSFDGNEIDWSFTTNFANQKSPRTLKRYRKMSPEIVSDKGSYVAFSTQQMLGYDSPEYSQPTFAGYNTYTGLARWDFFTWDGFFWDSSSYTPMECTLDGTAENIAFIIYGSSDYVPSFSINSLLVHYSPRRQMR